MSSVIRLSSAVLLSLLLGAGLSACGADDDAAQDDDLPIVVEESGPIPLGEAQPPDAEEVQVVDEEPQVVTRTVVVRERPAPRQETRVEEPEYRAAPTPARPSAIPSGTRIPIALMAQVDSEHNDVGSSWTGRVTRDVVVNGTVVIPSGAAISGVVLAMDEGDDNGGAGSITLSARSIETVQGTRMIDAAPVSGGHSYADRGFPTKETAIGAGAGAVLGGIVGGKKGAAIGAGVGGAGGAAMGSQREDFEVAMNAGTNLTITLQSPVSL